MTYSGHYKMNEKFYNTSYVEENLFWTTNYKRAPFAQDVSF